MENPFECMEIEDTCFAMDKRNGCWRCRIMSVDYCPGTRCSSYKTVNQIIEQKEKCHERLKSLPAETRARIIQNYGQFK